MPPAADCCPSAKTGVAKIAATRTRLNSLNLRIVVSFYAGVRLLTVDPGQPSRAARAPHAAHPLEPLACMHHSGARHRKARVQVIRGQARGRDRKFDALI